MDRRLFLKRAASLIAAPAIVPIQALMPIRGDAISFDTSGLMWLPNPAFEIFQNMVDGTLQSRQAAIIESITGYNALLRYISRL